MVVCFYIPRFELVVAAGEGPQIAHETLAGRALAVAPLVGGEQRVGEVSGAAEAQGVARGMVLGEALARCPELVLVPGDPVQVAEVWESDDCARWSRSARPSSRRGPGSRTSRATGCAGIHGTQDATLAAAARAGRLAIGKRPVRIGVGPTRFCALAAALAVRSRRPLVLDAREAAALARRASGRAARLPRGHGGAACEPLSRLGVRTLGELARLGRAALSDRFGAPGALAHRLACGEDSPLRPRRVEERLEESMEVGDASSGEALKRVLGVLVDRLLARPERRGRTLRAAMLSARLVAGGGWRERVVFRQALCDPRAHLAGAVAAPAAAARPGRRAAAEPSSASGRRSASRARCSSRRAGRRPAADPARAARLREAVAQVRAVAGPGCGAARGVRRSRLARARAAGGAGADPGVMARAWLVS